MTQRPQRLCNRVMFCTTDQQVQGLDLLVRDGLSDRSFHIRRALQLYLAKHGLIAAQPPNEQQHQAAE